MTLPLTTRIQSDNKLHMLRTFERGKDPQQGRIKRTQKVMTGLASGTLNCDVSKRHCKRDLCSGFIVILTHY